MTRHNRRLLEAAARMLLAWAVLAVLTLAAGRELIGSLTHFLALVTEGVSSDFGAVLRWKTGQPRELELVATFVSLDPALRAIGVQPTARFVTSTHLEHVLVPVVLVFTALSAWPVRRWLHRLVLLALGVPAALLSLALTTPFLLAGKVEIVLQQRAQSMGVERPEPFFLTWMLFTESGGRWLVPIVLACVCVWLLEDTLRRRAAARPPPARTR